MACIFPGAPDLERFWRLVREGVDAVTEVPVGRWDPAFYDPDSDRSDKLYTHRGGFIDEHAVVDPLAWGIMPVAARGAEPDQLLALEVCGKALEDAGYGGNGPRSFDRGRTSVVLGRGNYSGVGRLRLELHTRHAEQLVRALRDLVPGVEEAALERVRATFQAAAGAPGADAAIGLVPNLTASRVANRLDLHGGAHTLDAACASALVAVDQAMMELRSGRADMVLAGGIHICQAETFWSVFCQLGAMSHAQVIRPFDRRADGLLIGEGLGVLALRRLSDARRDGDRVYAVIAGSGISSDGRSATLMSPSVEGQLMALERAWKEAGVDPKRLGLLEAHGTATPAGDGAELETLRRFFGPPDGGERPALGSVKSNIGHAMPAAGAAGLIKAALSLYHRTLPPSLHCEEPRPEVGDTRFRVLAKAEAWKSKEPRVAGVNAFGFGGINGHAVLLEADRPRHRRSAPPATAPRLLRLAAADPDALLAALETGAHGGRGPCRLAMIDPTPERLAAAAEIVRRGHAWPGRQEIWYAPRALCLEGGKVALLFPGVDPGFAPSLSGIASRLGIPAPTLPPGEDIAARSISVIELNRFMARALEALGLEVHGMAGHSIGEWSANLASDLVPAGVADHFLAKVRPGDVEVPGVLFAAVGASAEAVLPALEGIDEVGISHDNCPHQIILCGHEASVEEAVVRLRARGHICQILPFKSGFHTPYLADYLGPFRESLAGVAFQRSRVPMWSATTASPYPADAEGIRDLVVRHLLEPVGFRRMIEAMYADGFRVFVQAGSGSLVGFVNDSLKGRPHLAMGAQAARREGLTQLRHLAAALWTQGARIDPTPLFAPEVTRAPMRLVLDLPLVRFTEPLAVGVAPVAEAASTDPVAIAFAQTMAAVQGATQAVQARMDARPSQRSLRLPVSVERFPWLLDHCFFAQAPGWTELSDRHPVVPMTTTIAWMIEAALPLCPGKVAVAVEEIAALRWIAVAPPVELEIQATREGDRVRVVVAGYAEATVLFADRYPRAPAADPGVWEGATKPPITAAELYSGGWMFHGPAFQGVDALIGWSRAGLHGTLRTLPSPGALLDNAGQLLGYWVQVAEAEDRLAMPIGVQRIRFFGPDPAPGSALACAVFIRELDGDTVTADLSLDLDGRAWCRIEGWRDRRFKADAAVWPVVLRAQEHLLARPLHHGAVLFDDHYRSAVTRDWLSRRFLRQAEREAYASAPLRYQRDWLSARIAAKDALRADEVLAGKAVFPAEIWLEDGPEGSLRVRAPEGRHVDVAIQGGQVLAVAGTGAVGAAIESVDGPGGQAGARARAARRAAARATGAAPETLALAPVGPDCYRFADLLVHIARHGDLLLAWTAP